MRLSEFAVRRALDKPFPCAALRRLQLPPLPELITELEHTRALAEPLLQDAA